MPSSVIKCYIFKGVSARKTKKAKDITAYYNCSYLQFHITSVTIKMVLCKFTYTKENMER